MVAAESVTQGWFLEATRLRRAGDLARAEALLAAILRLDSAHAGALNQLGVIAAARDRLDEAVGLFDRAVASKPDFTEAIYRRSLALQKLGRFEESLSGYDEVIGLRPDLAIAHYNRGIVLEDLDRHGEAVEAYTRAIALGPDDVRALNNRGLAQHRLNRLQSALADFDRAIDLRARLPADVEPTPDELGFNKALSLLLAGDPRRGFAFYEHRLAVGVGRRTLLHGCWSGREPLARKRLLTHWEQGLGDTLQFCRYVPLLARRGARVLLEAQAPLLPLLRSLDGVEAVLTDTDPRPQFDLHCPLLSLPAALNTDSYDVPAPGRYLAAEDRRVAAWRERLGPRRRPRVGLVWRGNPAHKNDRNRSLSLADLLAELPAGLDYMSLQKEVGEADRSRLAASGVTHLGDELKDFSDTAALCELADLIVSVDTSVAHLAGALGRPLWILLPLNPDWRWLLDRSDRPWYPTARLYRQARAGDWRDVSARVSAELGARFAPL